MRTSFLQGPRLNTNVNTNSGYSGFGQILMNDATRGLNRNEKKRQSNLDNAYKDKVFNQNKARDERNFNYQKTRDETKDTQWKTIFNNRVSQQNKPNYSTVPTLDNGGNPTIKLFDKNSGNFKDTQLTPYTKPKQLSLEQQSYYQARNEELQQKRLTNMIKTLDWQYPGIGEEERIKAINYINQNGQMPIIKNDNGWFGKGYFVEMDNKQKQKTHKEIGKEIDKEINSINNFDVHEKRFYNRNSRDLVKAKEWSKKEGKKYISDLWFPNEKELLQRYFKYGKDKK